MNAQAPEPSASTTAHGQRAVTRLQWLWLGAVFVVGLGYAVLVAPFQTMDEGWHWHRVWSVAQGDYNCKQMPNAAEGFAQLGGRFDHNRQKGPLPLSSLRDLYRHVGDPGGYDDATAACKYPPTGFVPAGLMVRLATRGGPFDLHAHKMFYAFYLARLANWLFFFGCVVAAFRWGRYPWPPLVFASIPLVVQQGMAINNDSVQLGTLLLAGALLTRTPTRATLWSAIALICLSSTIKPMNAIAATLVILSLWVAVTQHGLGRLEAIATAVLAVALPLGAWLLWNETMVLAPQAVTTPVPVANVDRAAQLSMMRAEPLRVLKVLGWQAQQLFTGSPLNGSWRGILFVIGWYQWAGPAYVYVLALPALFVGLALLGNDARGAFSARPVPRTLVALGALSVVPYFAVITLVLYLEFTPVGHEGVYGVQGRYYLSALCILLFLAPMAGFAGPRAWLASRMGKAFLVLGLAAHVAALCAIRHHFWTS